jgi:hypothetical protein
MLKPSESDISFARKKALHVSSVLGFAILMSQAQMCFAQDSPTPPASPTPVKTEITAPITAPAVAKVPNSVAVLDLGVRQEHQDFFYDEKQSAKSSLKKKRTGADAKKTEGPDLKVNPEMPAPGLDVDAQSDSSYSKQYGYKTRITYQELKGLMVDVRAVLKNAGYTVIQPQGVLSKEMHKGEILTVKERLAAGDFGGAQYVMIPNVVDASVRSTKEAIQGSSDYANRFEMNITVEFAMVNTDNQVVLASFNASGSGADTYIGKDSVQHVPDFARVKREMLASFGADAKKKLLEQLPKPGTAGPSEQKTEAGSTGVSSEGDAKTLKVYRVTDTDKETSKDEKKPEEIRVYR